MNYKGVFMSDKPSLYVVEKKEVVILVVLFVLVTVLAFSMGVKYGESLGKNSVHVQEEYKTQVGATDAGEVGGKLGEAEEPPTHAAPAEAHGEKKEEHGAKHEAEPAKHEEEKPHAAEPAKPAPNIAAQQPAIDKNSDEALLKALKEEGVEPPGGKSPEEAALPSHVKAAKSGSFVIQVGSHPTRGEAESQIRQLKAKGVNADVLAPFKDKQGEWHRVVVGSYKNKREADREAAQLKAKGAILSYFVWRLP